MVPLGIEYLRGLGYKITKGDHIYDEWTGDWSGGDYIFAGTPRHRADDIHSIFSNPDVKLVIAIRGGHGCIEVLPLLDFDLLRQYRKPFIAYSDVTILQGVMADRSGIPAWQGPMVGPDFGRPGGVDMASLNACISRALNWELGTADGMATLREGKARGTLRGGCLSLLVASLHHWDFAHPSEDGTVLFVEEVNESVDLFARMWREWARAGKLEGVTGIVFGEMENCFHGAPVRATLEHLVEGLNIPIAFGLHCGHVKTAPSVTLPLGSHVELECHEQATLRVARQAE